MPLSQVAALPVRGKPGAYEVLLITSRGTRRWVIPKGWPMAGRKDCDAAAQEAFEEAGVLGRVHKHPMSAFIYEKHRDHGAEMVRVMVYLLEVHETKRHWPEKSQRTRKWMTTAEAAHAVDEPGLIEIFGRLNAWPE